jgi:hypothetical protein
MFLAHRVAWLMAGRRIDPARPYILHDCPGGDEPSCCEVTHLWDGTLAENNLDRARKGRSAGSRRGLPFGAVPSRKRPGRFESYATIDGRYRFLGTFDSVEEASTRALERREEWLSMAPPTGVRR